jgi:hypothetical protein
MRNPAPVLLALSLAAADRITGIRVTASYIHLKGLEIKLVPQNITTQNESWGITRWCPPTAIRICRRETATASSSGDSASRGRTRPRPRPGTLSVSPLPETQGRQRRHRQRAETGSGLQGPSPRSGGLRIRGRHRPSATGPAAGIHCRIGRVRRRRTHAPRVRRPRVIPIFPKPTPPRPIGAGLRGGRRINGAASRRLMPCSGFTIFSRLQACALASAPPSARRPRRARARLGRVDRG